MRLQLLPFFTLLILASCMSQKEEADMQAKADKPVYCDSGADCAMKWRKAYRWVEDNSHYDIGKSTDTEITTKSVDSSTYAGMRVTKKLQEDGTYQILFHASCANMLGCFPDPLRLEASFAAFVDADDDTPVAENDTELGLTFAPVDAARMSNQLVISAVEPSSPAARAGLHAGDKLLTFNGHKIDSVEKLNEVTSITPAGSVVTIDVEQNGRTIKMFMRV